MADEQPTFTCAACGQTFKYGWSDEQARAEFHEHFGREPSPHRGDALVCDDCYHKVVEANGGFPS